MLLRRTAATLLLLASLLLAGLNSGSQTCPSSGSKAVIAAQSSCPGASCKSISWTIQAPVGNTGTVYVGGSTVTTSSGVALVAGASATSLTQGNAFPYDLTQTFIACTASGDSITFNYTQ